MEIRRSLCVVNRILSADYIPALLTVVMAAALGAGCAREPTQTLLGRGMSAALAGDYQKARRDLAVAARRLPSDPSAQYNLGVALWKLGMLEDAVRRFQKAAQLAAGDPRPMEFIGMIRIEMRRWEDARVAFDKALRESAPSARLYTECALAEMHAGNSERARAFLARALELDPSYPPALYNLGILEIETSGGGPAAADLLERFIKVAGDNRYAENARRHLEAIRRPIAHNSTAQYESRPKETALRPAGMSGVESLLSSARAAIRKEQYDEALVLLNDALRRHPRSADALWEMALLYDKHLGFAAEAAQTYDRFASMFPSDPRAGQARAASGRQSNIRAQNVIASAAEEISEVDRKGAQEMFLDGLAKQKAGDLKGAVARYQKALKLNPAHADAAYNMALAHRDDGNMKAAREGFELALAINPEMTKAAYMAAVTCLETRDVASAIPYLERVTRVEPGNARAHYLLGLAWKADLRFDKAAAEFETFLRLAPHDPLAREARDWLGSYRKKEANR